MAYEFKLPDLGEGLTEGEVARWLVSEGQEVAEDDPLVEIQTDKTTVEIPSPAAGIVARILVGAGEIVPVGSVLVVIGDDAEAPADQGGAGEAAAGEVSGGEAGAGEVSGTSGEKRGSGSSLTPDRVAARGKATPLVRRIAKELGVAVDSVDGSGPGGRITEEDVRRAAVSGDRPQTGPEGRRVPLRGVRRRIAEHLARAHREIPPVTWVEECDFSGVDLALLVPTVLQAAARSLRDFPELNARLEGDEIVYLERYDLGVAVQTEQGLVVPVVRACDTRPLDELAADVRRLADGARAGTLKPEELRGSTFTVTSAGKLAGLFQTPIVNHPEVAILSLGRVAERPVVRDGVIMARPIGTVAITFDHRVVDGARAAAFGLEVIGRIESGD